MKCFLLAALLLVPTTVRIAGADQFDDIVAKARAARQPLLIDFGSVGCVQCKKMVPVLNKLEDEYKGRMPVLFVDVRTNSAFPSKYGIYGIPTQVFIDKAGKEYHRHVGFFSYEEIKAVLKKQGL